LPGPMAYQLSRIEPFGFLIIILLLVSGVFQSLIGPLIMGSAGALINLALP